MWVNCPLSQEGGRRCTSGVVDGAVREEEEVQQRGCFTAPRNHRSNDEKKQFLTQVLVPGQRGLVSK